MLNEVSVEHIENYEKYFKSSIINTNDVYIKIFPLEINKNKIKKIEDILEVNITISTSDEKYNIFPMFVSENIYKNDLNLFNYQNHICYIKDLNKYLCRNNKYNNKSYF